MVVFSEENCTLAEQDRNYNWLSDWQLAEQDNNDHQLDCEDSEFRSHPYWDRNGDEGS